MVEGNHDNHRVIHIETGSIAPPTCSTRVLLPSVEELHLRTWWNLLPVSAHSPISHESFSTNSCAKNKLVIILLRWPTVSLSPDCIRG